MDDRDGETAVHLCLRPYGDTQRSENGSIFREKVNRRVEGERVVDQFPVFQSLGEAFRGNWPVVELLNTDSEAILRILVV